MKVVSTFPLYLLLNIQVVEGLLNYSKLSTNQNFSSHHLQMRLNPTSFKGTDFTITEFPRPTLRRVPNKDILEFDGAFEKKTQEMIGMMYESKGVGLAAPQVGLNENFFVYNPTGDAASKSYERIVCNPSITKYSPEVEVEKEGCLSLRSDDCAGQVARSIWIETEYQNEMGQNVKRRIKGFEARVFQHEYDHLKGILCYDRFPPEDREAVQANIDKLLGLYTEEDAIVDPDEEEAKSMQPRPLSARQMPPLEMEVDEAPKKEKKKKSSIAKSGFGAGGFGATKKKSSGPKKEKKKKVKARNGNFSSNPTFK